MGGHPAQEIGYSRPTPPAGTMAWQRVEGAMERGARAGREGSGGSGSGSRTTNFVALAGLERQWGPEAKALQCQARELDFIPGAGKVLSKGYPGPPQCLSGDKGGRYRIPSVPKFSVPELARHAFPTWVPSVAHGVPLTQLHACGGGWSARQSLRPLCPQAGLAPVSPHRKAPGGAVWWGVGCFGSG